MKKLAGIIYERLLLAAGIIWTAFFIPGFSASGKNVPFFIAVMGIGILIICFAVKLMSLRKRAEIYTMCFADKPGSELSEIAKTMNIPIEKAVKELEELIAKGYLNNIYIDKAEGRVKILTEKDGGLHPVNSSRLICPSFGASNKIVGDAWGKSCSYCNSPLDGTQ